MNLKSDNRASTITNYQPLFTPCYHNGEFHIAIRSFDRTDGLGYFLLVHPDTLVTSIVLKGAIEHRKVTTNLGEIGYYTQEDINKSRYGIALNSIKKKGVHQTVNAGMTHSRRHHKENQVFLTVDLCPSKKLFEEGFFRKLVEISGSVNAPVPVAICITEFWRTLHQEEFEWLLEQQNKTLQITWVNHSSTHVYYHDIASPEMLDQNFLLGSRTNLAYEFFEIEKSLIERNQTPSVFFRAPGLVTNEKIIDALDKLGLILLGADAWLAKGEEPCSGSIILVHGNSNEPAGISKMMTFLESNLFDFLPLQEALSGRSDYSQAVSTNYPSSTAIHSLSMFSVCQPCCSNTTFPINTLQEETDSEDERELSRITSVYYESNPEMSWKKSNAHHPGVRFMEGNSYINASTRLKLFRALKSERFEINQNRDPETGVVNLQVQLATIKS